MKTRIHLIATVIVVVGVFAYFNFDIISTTDWTAIQFIAGFVLGSLVHAVITAVTNRLGGSNDS